VNKVPMKSSYPNPFDRFHRQRGMSLVESVIGLLVLTIVFLSGAPAAAGRSHKERSSIGSFKEKTKNRIGRHMQRTENNLGIAVIEELYALSQVAQILRCSRKTVYRLISSGRLRAVRWGRSYRFRREDVEEFVRTSLIRVPKAVGGPPRS
jgi:excisionase family DNA binding protein